ncbi:mechanosensitive ion channel domain-containing protein [uncultured Gimesia sp.]|uniref:mechanosensitive ion channel domain-containing protein n=1 Tax=uncultured Gimesia sp. TaxID=1678688 RepID=UPI00261EE51E|nr:mechanosensitive ion channel domain-containing protein [uncultured Gimesia sp.]
MRQLGLVFLLTAVLCVSEASHAQNWQAQSQQSKILAQKSNKTTDATGQSKKESSLVEIDDIFRNRRGNQTFTSPIKSKWTSKVEPEHSRAIKQVQFETTPTHKNNDVSKTHFDKSDKAHKSILQTGYSVDANVKGVDGTKRGEKGISEVPSKPISPLQDEMTVNKINEVIKNIERSETVDAKKKLEYLAYLTKAIKWIENAKEYQAKTGQFEAEIKQAPELLKQSKKKLEAETQASKIESKPDATLAQLEQQLGQAKDSLKTAQAKLVQTEKDLNSKERTNRKTELTKLKESTKSQLEKLATESKSASSESLSEQEAYVIGIENKARQMALTQQLLMFDAEINRSEALVEIFPIQRDLAKREVSLAEKMVESYQVIVNEFRSSESKRQANEARNAASNAHPAVREYAEANVLLAESRTNLTKKIDVVSGTSGYLLSAQGKLTKINEDFESVKQKIEVYGMTPTIGLLLRNRRDHLPAIKIHKQRIVFSELEMQAAQVALLELENDRSQLGDYEKTIEKTLVDLDVDSEKVHPQHLENIVRELIKDRRQYLDSLILDYHTYHDNLSNLELVSRELITKTNSYRSYIDEQILWIPSANRLGKKEFAKSYDALASFLKPQSWIDVYKSTTRNARDNPITSLLLVLTCIVLLASRKRLQRWLNRLGQRNHEENHLSFIPTFWALVITVFLAAVGPLMFWCVGWWMSLNQNATDLVLGLADAFTSVAVFYFVIELVRMICRDGGLADKHFGWPQASLAPLYRNLNRFAFLALPTLFVVSLLSRHQNGEWQNSLGRLSFLAGLGVLGFYLHLSLRPSKGAIPQAFASSGNVWGHRFRFVTYLFGIGFPITLAALLYMGYVYTANQLLQRMWLVVCFLLALVLIQELVTRGFLVVWNQMKEKISLKNKFEKLKTRPEMHDDITLNDSTIDLENVSRQLSQLVRGAAFLTFLCCNWFVWSDVLPALQIFDRVELWNITEMVNQRMQTADGKTITEQVPQIVPITLADLMLSVFAIIGTYVATKTLPGLLEISILGRLPIDNAMRHVIIMVSRYIVSLAGFILACHLVGVKWASVQWLAAAMTVGLGFGLQEIFANLVSGLIILFEQPIRIGDTVTVNGVTGTVTRMQIRATTITDYDRRESIIPNKRFITEDVVNWTLSDPITRFVIPVGISYDCDPTTASDLLLKVAKCHPLVLNDPGTTALFKGFGNSTLNLELRVFIGRRDDYITVLHDLNVAIKRAFQEADIEIAFPQQDLHIRSFSDSVSFGTAEQNSQNKKNSDSNMKMHPRDNKADAA